MAEARPTTRTMVVVATLLALVATLSPVPMGATVAGAAPRQGSDRSVGFPDAFNGSRGRRAATGAHPASGNVRWARVLDHQAPAGAQGTAGALLDLDGHVLVPLAGELGVGDALAAVDLAGGALAWEADPATDQGRLRPGCTTVAPDGTIWTVSRDLPALVALDPATGQEMVDRRVVVDDPTFGRCAAGLTMLGADAVVHQQFGTGVTRALDLRTGQERWRLTPTSVPPEVVLVADDGIYLLADDDLGAGPDLRLLRVDSDTGEIRGTVDLPGAVAPPRPMRTAYVDADGGIVLATSEADAQDRGAGWIVRVRVDGDDALALDWAVPTGPGDPLGLVEVPAQLLPGGGDGRDVAAVLGTVPPRVAIVDGATGEIQRLRALPGNDATLAGQAVADAAGSLLVPWQPLRRVRAGGTAWNVLSADLVGNGVAPVDVLEGLDGVGPITADGAVVALGRRDGEPAVVLIEPGEQGPVNAFPRLLGQAVATMELRGAGLAPGQDVALVGVGGATETQRHESIVRATDDAGRYVSTFDLREATLGTYRVLVSTAGGEVDAGTIEVVVTPTFHNLEATVAQPETFRVGFPATVRLTIRNRNLSDVFALPVFMVFEDFPPGTTVEPIGVGQPPVLDDEPISPTVTVDRTVSYPIAVPHLPAGASTTIPMRVTVPAGAPTGQGRMRVVAGDCTHGPDGQALAPDLDPAELAELAGDPVEAAPPGFAGGAGQTVVLCLLNQSFNWIGGLPGVIPDLVPIGTPAAQAAAGCLLAGIYSSFSTIYDFGTIITGARDEILPPGVAGPPVLPDYTPLIWDVLPGLVGCLVSFSAYFPALAPYAAGIGAGLLIGGALVSAYTSCGGADLWESVKDWFASLDPNDITGPTGAGEPRWLGGPHVNGGAAFDYRIRFENDPTASADARDVVIRHTIPDGLDPATFQPGPLGWGEVDIDPPPFGDGPVTLRRNTEDGLAVDVTITRDGRDVEWRLATIDPATGQPPADPILGFLPPNVDPPEGDGFVTYRARPATDLADGDVVAATASIVFDANAPIQTNIWRNTIDLAPPIAAVELPSQPVTDLPLRLTLAGQDDASGVASWRVERTDLPGPVRVLAARTTDPELTVPAATGQTVRLAVTATDGAGNTQPEPTEVSIVVADDAVERVAGADRIATAAAVSARAFGRAPIVTLARADTYPDALAGAPLAYWLGGPLLLTGRDTLDPRALAEIRRLGAGLAVLLGGEGALSAQVAAELTAAGVRVARVAGPSRFATAAAVATELATLTPALEEDGLTAYVVQGEAADPSRGWADALAVAPIAARQGRPVLLTATQALPPDTADALTTLGVTRVVIVGGEASVGPTVVEQLGDLGVSVERVAGASRYATALAVAETAPPDAAVRWLATGRSFPDALSAGAAVAATGGSLLLVDGEDPAGSPAVLDAVAGEPADPLTVILVGGTSAVGPTTEQAVRQALAGR